MQLVAIAMHCATTQRVALIDDRFERERRICCAQIQKSTHMPDTKTHFEKSLNHFNDLRRLDARYIQSDLTTLVRRVLACARQRVVVSMTCMTRLLQFNLAGCPR